MLEAPKDGWSAPTKSAKDRCSTFSSPGMKDKISQTHAAYRARDIQLTAEGERELPKINFAVSIVRGIGAATEVGNAILDAVVSVAQSIADDKLSNIKSTIGHFGVVCGHRQENVKWEEIPEKVPYKPSLPCIVGFDVTETKGHAIAIYQTYGWMSTDFYVFDPNFGEWLCKGQDDCGKLLKWLQEEKGYNNPQKATIQEVHL
jgi:hypothetical protein